MGDGQSVSTTTKVAVGIGIVTVGILAYALLSEEPPIRVKGGSLDVEILASKTEKWEQDGTEWKLKSGGGNIFGKYNFKIAIGSHCSPPPSSVKEVNIAMAQEDVQIKTNWFKTRIRTKGHFQQVSDKLLTYSGSDAVTVTVKPGVGNNNQWQCVFPRDEFQELCLYRGTPCP